MTESPEEEIAETLGQVGSVVGVSMVGMGMMVGMMSDLNFQQNGQATGNSPQPGTPGGGGSPSDGSIGTLATALALVPAGLTAVAVFPPFAT